jgi:D-alanine-D-alanine ligase
MGLKKDNYFVWVLAPELQSDDPNINYYYDFSENKKEFERAYDKLQIDWKWQPVTLVNYKEVIQSIVATTSHPLVFNLCDGDEVNGTPGISVIQYLKENGIPFTGADESFYHLTTSKIVMKKAFDKCGVSNAPWFSITSRNFKLNSAFKNIPKPVIIKPAVSAGSIGLGTRNVLSTELELRSLIKELYKGYRGWELAAGGFVAEAYIKGEEYTSFVVGSSSSPSKLFVYPAVE